MGRVSVVHTHSSWSAKRRFPSENYVSPGDQEEVKGGLSPRKGEGVGLLSPCLFFVLATSSPSNVILEF